MKRCEIYDQICRKLLRIPSNPLSAKKNTTVSHPGLDSEVKILIERLMKFN